MELLKKAINSLSIIAPLFALMYGFLYYTQRAPNSLTLELNATQVTQALSENQRAHIVGGYVDLDDGMESTLSLEKSGREISKEYYAAVLDRPEGNLLLVLKSAKMPEYDVLDATGILRRGEDNSVLDKWQKTQGLTDVFVLDTTRDESGNYLRIALVAAGLFGLALWGRRALSD